MIQSSTVLHLGTDAVCPSATVLCMSPLGTSQLVAADKPRKAPPFEHSPCPERKTADCLGALECWAHELVGLGWGLRETPQQLVGEEEEEVQVTQMKEQLHLNGMFQHADVSLDGVDCHH